MTWAVSSCWRVRAHACMHECIGLGCMYTCMYACGGLRTTSAVIPQVLSTLFLRQDLSLTWSLPSRQGWPAYELDICFSLPPHIAGIWRGEQRHSSATAHVKRSENKPQTLVLSTLWDPRWELRCSGLAISSFTAELPYRPLTITGFVVTV